MEGTLENKNKKNPKPKTTKGNFPILIPVWTKRATSFRQSYQKILDGPHTENILSAINIVCNDGCVGG